MSREGIAAFRCLMRKNLPSLPPGDSPQTAEYKLRKTIKRLHGKVAELMGHAADLHQKRKGLACQEAMRTLLHSSIMMPEIALIENATQHGIGRSAIAGRGIVKGHDAGRAP